MLSEFGYADLGDKRRSARLIELAGELAQCPEGSLPRALAGAAALKAAYRFFDNADISHEHILAPHVASTLNRARGYKCVLAVQDTSFIDYASHPHTTGLGPTGAKGGWGMICHATLAFSTQRLPLGVLGLRLWAREPGPSKRASRRKRTVDKKESGKWIDGLHAAAQLAGPDTRVVSVADRESDVYEFFTEAHRLGIDLLTRAAWDRNVDGEHGHLFDTLAVAPVVASRKVRLPARKEQPARVAQLKVHACPVTLHSPLNGPARGWPSLKLWGVWAHEPNPPHGVQALDWKLLTTVPVVNAKDALERLDWYVTRWGIELWHRVLKSGCKVEQRQLASFERLTRLFAIYAVIAWRIFNCTVLARLLPDVSCTAILTDDEWQALYCRIHLMPTPPPTPPPLRQAVRWIAKLGGFIGRKSDGEPGSQTLWRGFHDLIACTEMYRIMKNNPTPTQSLRTAQRQKCG